MLPLCWFLLWRGNCTFIVLCLKIWGQGFLAYGTLKVFGQPLAAFAHPADLFCRVAYHQGMVRDVLCHDGAGADKGIAADGVATDDGAVGTQGGALPDKGGADLVHLADFGAGVVDIGENHGGAAEDAVFKGDAFIDADVVLDLAFGADGGVGADDDVLADVAGFADFGIGEDVGEVPDLRFFAYLYIIIYYSCFVGEKTNVRS